MPLNPSFDIKAESEIIQAAVSGDTKILLEKVTVDNVNMRASNNSTPLMFAAEAGHLDAVKHLIKMGADVNIKNEDYTALMYASSEGQADIIYFLLTEGGASFSNELKEISKIHASPLKVLMRAAIKEGHLNLARYLLTYDSVSILKKDDDNDDENPVPILLYCCMWGRLDIAQLLIENGASINTKCGMGATALIVAAIFGRFEIIKYLLTQGANIDSKNKEGNTALSIYSAFDGVNENGKRCFSILTAAAKLMELAHNKSIITAESGLKILKEFLDAGASVYQRGEGGKTPLHLAAECGNSILVSLFLEHGANPNSKDEYGLTPSQLAQNCEYREIEVLILLHQDKQQFDQDHSRKCSEERLKQIENRCSEIKDAEKRFEAFYILGKRALELVFPGIAYRAFSQIEIGSNKTQYKEAQFNLANLYIGRQISLEGEEILHSLDLETKETIEQKQAYIERILYHMAHAGMSEQVAYPRKKLTNEYFNAPSVDNVSEEYGDPCNRDGLLALFDKHQKLKTENDKKQKKIDFLKKQLADKDAELATYKTTTLNQYRGERRQGPFWSVETKSQTVGVSATFPNI